MKRDEDFNLKVTVRNGRLLRAIRARYSSVADMCRKMGRSHQTVNKLITMKAVPYNSKGWTDLALDIAGMVARDPEDLWPDHMRELRLRKSTSEVNLDLDDVKKLVQEGSSEKTISQLSALSQFSKNLTPRERDVLARRFAHDQSLDECAASLRVSRERVRQIEAKAFRKMRKVASNLGYMDVKNPKWDPYDWETGRARRWRLKLSLKPRGQDLLED
jgi:RNA polymerase sigma factor (sigma-70 family)